MKFIDFLNFGEQLIIFDGVDLLHNRIESNQSPDESSNQYRGPRNELIIVRRTLYTIVK